MLKLLLSFAVGSLLGDVFLHLLPEAWATVSNGKLLMLVFKKYHPQLLVHSSHWLP